MTNKDVAHFFVSLFYGQLHVQFCYYGVVAAEGETTCSDGNKQEENLSLTATTFSTVLRMNESTLAAIQNIPTQSGILTSKVAVLVTNSTVF